MSEIYCEICKKYEKYWNRYCKEGGAVFIRPNDSWRKDDKAINWLKHWILNYCNAKANAKDMRNYYQRKLDITSECGVYIILNCKNFNKYIGSSKNVKKRTLQHINQLIKNNHKNLLLQDDFNRNPTNFEVRFIERTSKKDRKLKEQLLIELYEPDELYNKIDVFSNKLPFPCI